MKIRGRLAGGMAVRWCAVLALLLGLVWAGGCASPQMGPAVGAFNDAMDKSLAVYHDYDRKVHDLKNEQIIANNFRSLQYKISLIAGQCEPLVDAAGGGGKQTVCNPSDASKPPKQWNLCVQQTEPRRGEQGGVMTALQLERVPPDPNAILIPQMKTYAANLLAIANSDSAAKINKYGQEIGESMNTISQKLAPKGSKAGAAAFAVSAVAAVGQWSVAYMQYDAFRQYIPAADPIIAQACTNLESSTLKRHKQLVSITYALLCLRAKDLSENAGKLSAGKKREKVLALQKDLEELQEVASQKPWLQFEQLRKKHKALADAAQKSMEDFTLLEPDMQTLANQAAELAAAIKKLRE